MSQTKHCHPLKYAGSSQVGRLVAALQPHYFRLDERSLQDLIVATHHYAQALRFFDHNDQHPEGAYWDRFWEVEMLTYLAVVAAKDTDELRRKYEEADRAFFKKINEKTGGKKGKNTGESPLAGYLPLIELLHQLAWSLEDTYQKLARIGHPLQTRLLNSIRRDNCCDTDELESALRKLIKFHKAATPSKTPLSYTRYEGFFSDDKRWGLRNRTDFEAIVPDTQITQEALREIFITYYDAWLLLKRDAQEAFDTELARAELPEDVEERAMEPHVALFIAFLRLFRHAQDSLNDLGEKHLDYYYDQILGFCRRPETPDEVWLIFELAKDVDQFLLQKGEAFLAGNDKNGAPLLFENLEDWVLRQATVADIRNTYIDRDCGKINANPDISKAYENRVEKPNESTPHWRSMGDDNHLPDGHIGWAFASPQLILREGKRIIDLKMQVAAPDNPNLSWIAEKDLFGVWLSTEEDWVRLEHNPTLIGSPDTTPELPRGAFNVFFTDKTLHFRIVLERDDPAIEAFGEEAAAKAGFDTQWPMLKVVINPTRITDCPPNNPAPTTAEIYEALRNLCIGEIRIGVKASGIRENLIFQNDQGLYDGTQKVFPFGPVPEVGNKFYLGSTEVFQKALNCLKVCFDWIAPPGDFNKHYAAYQHNNDNNSQSPKINFPLPNPFLKIDFIDRADVPVPKQLVKLGKRSDQENVSGVLTDLNGIPLQGIRVILLDANNKPQTEVLTDANGSYSMPGPIEPKQTIVFSPPKQSDSDPDQSVLYEALPVTAEEFSVINAVLFPKSVVFGKFEQINGRLEDIYGNPISSGVSVSLGGTTLAINSNGEFTAAAKGQQNLVIAAQAAQFKPPSPNDIQLDDFTRIRIILEPAEKVQPLGSTIGSTTDPRIYGTIRNNRPAASPKPNAYAEVSNGDQTIKVFSDQNGAYELPLFAAGNLVRFYPDAYANSIVPPSPIAHSATRQTVNAWLIAETQVQKKFRENKVRVRVKNYENTLITSGVAFATTPAGPILTELIGQTFELTLPNNTIADDATTLLAISGSGYKTTSFRIEHYAEFEVMLLPVGFVLHSGIFAGEINGRVYDRNGTLLSGYEVRDNEGVIGAVTGSDYSITPNAAATKLIFTKTGFDDFEISINNASQINPFLKPETAALVIGAEIVGTLKQADSGPAVGAHVTVEGFINGKYAKYETQTDSSGAYNLLRANGLSISRFAFSRDGFVAEAQSAGALFLSGQIKKIHPVQPTLRGTVYDMNGPVENAVVILPNGNSTTTNKEGRYAFVFPSNGGLSGPANAIKISHPGYQTLEVNVEQGCLQLDLRLIPLPAHFVVSGKITDVLGSPVPQVQVGLADFAIRTMADNFGHYEIAIPFGIGGAPDLRFKAPAGFEENTLVFGAEYPNPGLNFDKSKANIILYYENINYVGLLDASSAIKPCFNVNINALNLVRDIRTQHFEKYSPTLRRGFLVFNLEETDFLHKAYPQALSYYALSAPALAHTLNPPYTPAVNGISLEYCSEQVITGAENAGIDRFYHLLPFNGHKEVSLLTPDRLPVYPYNPHDLQQPPKALDPYATGNLYIGIEKLRPGSAISLLFRVAAGTERNPELLPPQLVWSWLGPDNRWHPFGPGQVLRDETRGLTRSGMVQLAVPNAAVNRTTMLPGDLYWLRVAAIEEPHKDRSAHALPALGGIDAQVVRARFANKGNELSHLAASLPAGTISGLLESRAEVRGVTQPLPSVGGRLPESMGFAFRTRVSERLRHKDRAVTPWDFERLLLERYPDVAVARCIPHTRYKTAAKATELAPGYVSIAVAPNPALHDAPWPKPRFPQGDLDEMRDFLAARANLFVAYGEGEEAYLQVLNPHYETLDIQVNVRFLPEYSDEAFYEKKLAEELRDYISPWLANPQAPPVFGRSIARSKILQFIEERYYVDYVDMSRDDWGNYTEFRIRRLCVNTAGQILDRQGNPLAEKCLLTQPPGVEWVAEKACPATARSIFVAGYIAVNAPLPDLIKCPVVSGDPTDGNEQDGEIDEVEERLTSVVILAQGAQPKAAASAAAAPKEKKSRKPRQTKSK